MRLLAMMLLLVFAGMAGGTGVNTDRPLLVGSEPDFPPFAVGQADKTMDGFAVDLWKAVAKEAGLSYTIRVQTFNHILHEFETGRIDVLINLAPSEERRRFADFTVPYVTVNGAIFVRKSEPGIRSEADLAGKSIIVLNADLARDYAISRGWQKRLVQVNTVAEGFRLLASGQHDAMLIGKLVGMQTLQQSKISNIRALDVKPGFSQKFSFAVQKSHTELLARINEGLALTKSSGVYDAIYEKWFGVYEKKEPTFKDMLKYLVPLVIGFMGFAAFFLHERQSERRQAAEALRIQQDRLHLILDSTAEAIYGIDLEGNCTFCNASCVNLLGYTHAQELLGKNMHRQMQRARADETHHPVDKRLIFHNFERGAGAHAEDEMLWRADGSCFPVEYWSYPQFQDGLIIGAVVTFIDVTERKRAEHRERAHKQVLGLLAKCAPLKEILQSITDSIELENPAM
ncbi:MAG: transporter substrate-binding domain-containing protein, partial [Methylophilaceae bacterium]